MMRTLPLGKPDIPASVLPELKAILESGMLVEGARCEAFARELAAYAGVPHAILVNSGTSALYLALLALGIGPGDAVLVPSFSFPATANAVAWAGALPVFADIDARTWNMDAATVTERLRHLPVSLRRRIKAVMPVQAFGNPVAMGPLLALAREQGWKVIEDAACAIGSALDGRACGTHGTVGCLSFHPRKVLTTSEGGALLTRDARLAKRLALLRNHGMTRAGGKVRFPGIGLNLRFTEMAAALGRAQLARLPAMLAERARQAEAYRKAFAGTGILLQESVPGGTPNAQSLVARLPGASAAKRDRAIAVLQKQGIQCTIGTYYLPSLPSFRKLEGARACPEAAAVARQTISLPLFPGLDNPGIGRVAKALIDLA